MSSLCPGYKHVAAFAPDDEYDDDEEVAYVTLDLGSVEPTLVPNADAWKGLDTPTPFMQLSGTILKGRHDELLGTELLFTEGKDPHDSAKKTLVHVASTEQRICFREVRLVPKGAGADLGGGVGVGVGSGAGTTKKGKGKSRESGEAPPLEWSAEAEAAALLVDRVAGKTVPRTRAARRKGRVRDADAEDGDLGEGEDAMDVEA
ncbi:hypothetical protein C0992_004499 [Termitomyces sp. T32_za158]|nr:hypothetical protein C0992_004499 [Termitomyces sp. T32_za158]